MNLFKIVKFILKIIPTLFVAFFALIAIAEGISDFIWSWESFAVGGVLILEIAAVVIVWAKEEIGKWFLAGAGLAKMILVFVTAGHNIILVGVILGAPLLVPGLILILLKDKNIERT